MTLQVIPVLHHAENKVRSRVFSRITAVLICFPLVAGAQSQPPQGTGEAWSIVLPAQSNVLLARDGSLIGESGKEWRTNISLSTLPPYVAQAFIAVEDQRFYQHDGVDLVGIAGALKDAVRGRPRGASTITQLLVGNMHPDIIDRRDLSPMRKLREQQAAREMEKRYTKQQILEAFLNQIHFGRNYFGIESAARHYFGKPASHLTIPEAATLAAMPKGPALYDPVRYPARTKTRRDVVLRLMGEQGYLTPDQVAAARATPLTTAEFRGMSVPAEYFVDVVRVQASRAFPRIDSVGGYRVFTTVDPSLQRAAYEALREVASEVEQRPGYRNPVYDSTARGAGDYLQGAVVAMDPVTGDVRALVGGRDYAQSPFNRAVNGRRQPGSSFKPFVYAAALADSVPPNEIVADTALAIAMSNRSVYRPSNSDGVFLGSMTMREALTRSRNPVAITLAARVGIDTVISLARSAGISSPIAAFPSSALGASVVQPLDLVAAYSVFANGGARVEPRFISRIEDDKGRVVWQNRIVVPPLVLDAGVAYIVRDMMRDVVERGTANSVRRYVSANIPVAGKTGTTDNNADVWFVGMTPGLVAGVWLGFDKPRSIAAGAAGGGLAAPVFGRMLQLADPVRAAAPWVPPGNLVIAELDRLSGQLATDATPSEQRYTEYFLDGTEPIELRMNLWRLVRGGRVVF